MKLNLGKGPIVRLAVLFSLFVCYSSTIVAQIKKLNRDSFLVAFNGATSAAAKLKGINDYYKLNRLDSLDAYFLADYLEKIDSAEWYMKVNGVVAANMRSRVLSKAGKLEESLAIKEEVILTLEEVLALIGPDHHKAATYKKMLVGNHLNCGMNHSTLYNAKVAINHLEKAIEISEEIGQKKYVSKGYTILARVYKRAGDVEKSTECLYLALEAEPSDDNFYNIETYVTLGGNYIYRNQYDEALRYYKKANELANKSTYAKIDAYKLQSLAGLHFYYVKTDDLPRADSVMQVLKPLSYNSQRTTTLIQRLLDHSQLLVDNNDFSNAKTSLEEARTLINVENVTLLASHKMSMAKLHMAEGNNATAIKLLNEAVSVFREKNSMTYLKQALSLLSESQFQNRDYHQSREVLREWQTLSDSLYGVDVQRQQELLTIQYETAKKENEIQKLRTIEVVQDQRISRQRILLGTAIALLCVLGSFLIYVSKNNIEKTKLNDSLTHKNSIIQFKSNQNELLLKEIHHRVKNNLQTISSLLYLQSATITDSDAKEAITQGQNRVESIALIHKHLYQRENLAGIEMKDYITRLNRNLQDAYLQPEETRSVHLDMEEAEIDVDTAIPLGLIINELLTNVYKYAFPDNASGHVDITFRRFADDKFRLRVQDNGIGKTSNSSGFGSQLVQLLSKQLEATFTEGNDNGYWCQIESKFESS